MFDPDKFPMEEENYDLEEHKLSSEDLKGYGALASQIRSGFEAKAKGIVDGLKNEEQ